MPYVDGPLDLPPAVPFDPGGNESGPPGMLLRPVAADAHPVDAEEAPLVPDRALALDADRLLSLLSRRTGRPARWSAPAFVREVELVRTHLRPVRSRPVLEASFGREAFHGQSGPGGPTAIAGSAARVAYALRWLELGDGVIRGSWGALLK